MRFFRYMCGEERAFLDSSFEPNGDGYGALVLAVRLLDLRARRS